MSVSRSNELGDFGVMGSAVLDYVEKTSSVNVTATAEASADVLVSGNPVTFDGQTSIIVHLFCPDVGPNNSIDAYTVAHLFEDGVSLGWFAMVRGAGTGGNEWPVSIASPRITPSAGSHTYSWRATTSTGTAVWGFGAGGSGANAKGYIRITRESALVTGVGIAGVPGGYAPLDSGLLIPSGYLPMPQSAAYKRTSGNYTTTSTSFADIDGTNMALTITTRARRVLIGFVGSWYNSGTNTMAIDFTVDGTRVGGDFGLAPWNINHAGNAIPICPTFLTDVLSAGAHTFKVQWKVSGGTGTMQGATAGAHCQFYVAEQL